jgi:metal-sulfur cluster biosynthetic enzyme
MALSAVPTCARSAAAPAARSAGARGTDRYPVPPEERSGPLWQALREVMDPEIPISLVDLGLIYDVRQDGGAVEVDLTFTATACPCMAFIHYDIQDRLRREPGVEEVRVIETWSPAWTKARISPEGRESLRRFGVSM